MGARYSAAAGVRAQAEAAARMMAAATQAVSGTSALPELSAELEQVWKLASALRTLHASHRRYMSELMARLRYMTSNYLCIDVILPLQAAQGGEVTLDELSGMLRGATQGDGYMAQRAGGGGAEVRFSPHETLRV